MLGDLESRARAVIAAAAAGALAVGAWYAADGLARDLGTPRDLHGARHATSAACRRCHPDHQQSWRRTYHRTMTQEATAESVLGDFDDARFEYFGVPAALTRRGERFLMTLGAGAAARTFEIARTVGSRRYQQYLADDGRGQLVRLPLAWHVEEGRWMHMNGAFLTPDPEVAPGAAASRADYERHVVRWNDNCVFCHNVAPDPGMGAEGFETRVAELGVACEACHGPADEHARRNASPLRRYALHVGGGADPTIVNPARLSPERSADVCGRCHGQRKTDDIERFLRRGDPFVPGDDLALYSEPLFVDTTLAGRAVFAPRFWPDGTARLTAYEYQGLLQSPCAQRGELTCTTCHGMHEGDPRGQLRPDRRGDGACAGCHDDLPPDHTRHEPRSSGSRCVECHMPAVVYGLVSIHRSHRIESPDPARQAALGRPDACTLCHVDRDRAWAAEHRERWWPGGGREAPAATALPEVEQALFGGDPIERAVAASALGRSDVAVRRDLGRRLGALLSTLRDDRYPGVRRVAVRAATRLLAAHAPTHAGAPAAFDPTGRPEARARRVAALERALAPLGLTAPAPDLVARLRERSRDVDIEIGE